MAVKIRIIQAHLDYLQDLQPAQSDSPQVLNCTYVECHRRMQALKALRENIDVYGRVLPASRKSVDTLLQCPSPLGSRLVAILQYQSFSKCYSPNPLLSRVFGTKKTHRLQGVSSRQGYTYFNGSSTPSLNSFPPFPSIT
jgi:hypothetical protein